MKSLEEAFETALDGSPFSNSTHGEIWTLQWCDTCIHDRSFREGVPEDGCPLLAAAYMSRTPVEWKEDPEERWTYLCSEYEQEKMRG